jgi:flagellar biosynthesis/type III secretory pathway protein FliH
MMTLIEIEAWTAAHNRQNKFATSAETALAVFECGAESADTAAERDEGYQIGYDHGYDTGYEAGLAEGRGRGYEEGLEEGRYEAKYGKDES